MQIPFGSNSGQAVANSPGVVSVPRGAFDTSSGITQLGQQGMQIAANDQRQELEQQQIQQRANAALTLQKTNNDMYTAHDEVARGVTDGSIAPDQAATELKTRVDKVKETNLADLSPFQRQIVDDNIVHTQGSIDRNLAGVIVKRNQSDTAATLDQFGEQVQRDVARIGPAAASSKYDALVDFSGAAAGLSPKQQADAKQKFKEGVHANFFDAAGTTALAKQDLEGITAVLQKVQGTDGDALDPKTRTVLTHKLYGYQQHIEAKMARDQNALDRLAEMREKQGADILDQAQELTLNAQYLDTDFIGRLAQVTAGTSSEAGAVALLAAQKHIAGFASLSAPERTAVIERMRNQGADPTKGTNPQAAKVQGHVEKLDSAIRSAVNENPIAAAQKYGVIKDAPLLDVSNISNMGAVLQNRVANLPQVEAWAGRKVSPLQPEEAEGASKLIRTLPIDQQASALAMMGQKIGDPERMAMVAKQIGDKDGHMGLAMAYTNDQTTQGRYTGELVLRGSQAIKDKTVKVDGAAESGWRASIAKQVRGAFSDQDMEDKYVESAFLITAGNGDHDVDRAVRLATGGIIDFNGSKVPMPYRMATEGQSSGEKKFKKAIESYNPDDISGQTSDGMLYVGNARMPVSQFMKSLPDARLKHAGQGQYNVQAGNTLVTNSNGQRIVLKVTP